MVEGSDGDGPEQGPDSKPAPSFELAGDRLRFRVDLRAGETTIVSWKKLLKEANLSDSVEGQRGLVSQSSPPPPPPPSFVAPSSQKQTVENEPIDTQAEAGSNRLSTVIERIERMYAGNGSSDEEDLVLDNVPDDDEYDTEDSFIDDTELDDYFQVDNSAIKHDGFFVNRGKLERIEPTISTEPQPKKRRRKDLTLGGGSDDGHNPHKIMKMGSKGRKATSSIQRSSTSQSHKEAMPNVHMPVQDPPANADEVSLKKIADIQVTADPSGLPNSDAMRQDMDTKQHRPEIRPSDNQISKSKESELQGSSAQRSNDKISHVSKSHSGEHLDNVDGLDLSIQQKEKGGLVERFDLNVPARKASLPPAKAALMHRKEGPTVRPKSTLLEKAIRELEKIVAEFRPPSTEETQDPDNASQAVKRRLPPEIKQKLAKVARIAQASYGKVPKDVINHLMSIVGHLMHITTLKRNLKAMTNMGLSAKQEKDDRIQKIKQEVAEMVKLRILHMKSKLEQHDANSDDFQEADPEQKEALKRKYIMDDVLENKICDLYDLYVERLEEDSGPPLRRLYEELALLWPSGLMHTDGIKRAVYRAKDRKGLCSHRKDQEKIKKKKALAPKAENAINVTQAKHIREKLSDSLADCSTVTNNLVHSAAAGHLAARVPVAFANGPNLDKPKKLKMKGGSSSSNRTDVMPPNVSPKKKVKREPKAEVAEAQFHLEKLAVSLAEKGPKHHKHPAGSVATSDLQPAVPPSGTD